MVPDSKLAAFIFEILWIVLWKRIFGEITCILNSNYHMTVLVCTSEIVSLLIDCVFLAAVFPCSSRRCCSWTPTTSILCCSSLTSAVFRRTRRWPGTWLVGHIPQCKNKTETSLVVTLDFIYSVWRHYSKWPITLPATLHQKMNCNTKALAQITSVSPWWVWNWTDCMDNIQMLSNNCVRQRHDLLVNMCFHSQSVWSVVQLRSSYLPGLIPVFPLQPSPPGASISARGSRALF